ncbi:MAG: 2-phospho-L-lactate transferase CofD family protein [Chloroflexota bacterium]
MGERSIVALAGGVGGAKLAEGLQARLGERLSVIVNTADDCERHGLLVMPDHDTVLYNLAGIEQAGLGWGVEGDTHAVMAQLGAYGGADLVRARRPRPRAPHRANGGGPGRAAPH